jgi:HK97 family phage prohead protease
MTSTIERRSVAIVGTEQGRDGFLFSGYGAVFHRPGDRRTEYVLWQPRRGKPGAIERIVPGAFARAIREDNTRALLNHDPNLVLGTTRAASLRLTEDRGGLFYEIAAGDTTVARNAWTWLKRREITGSSFSFAVRKERWSNLSSEWDVREIIEVELFDVGPVTFPAYAATTAHARSGCTLPMRGSVAAMHGRQGHATSREVWDRYRNLPTWARARMVALEVAGA